MTNVHKKHRFIHKDYKGFHFKSETNSMSANCGTLCRKQQIHTRIKIYFTCNTICTFTAKYVTKSLIIIIITTHFLEAAFLSENRYVHDLSCWLSAFCRTITQTNEHAMWCAKKSSINTFLLWFPHFCWLRSVAKIPGDSVPRRTHLLVALKFGCHTEERNALRSDHKITPIPT